MFCLQMVNLGFLSSLNINVFKIIKCLEIDFAFLCCFKDVTLPVPIKQYKASEQMSICDVSPGFIVDLKKGRMVKEVQYIFIKGHWKKVKFFLTP